MKKIIKQAALVLLSANLAFAPAVTYASGIPVVDVANLTQNILEAAHELQSNINEATMISNQITQITNEIKNLTSLKFSIINDFTSEFKDLYAAVGSVQGLMQNLNNLETKFEELYPDFNKQISLVTGDSIAQVSAAQRTYFLIERDNM